MFMRYLYVQINLLAPGSVCYDLDNPTLKYVINTIGKKVTTAIDTFGKIRRIKNGTTVIIKSRKEN